MRIRTGRKLDAYHDGKTSPSRLERVEVINVVRIEDLCKKCLRMWRKAILDDFDECLLKERVIYYPGPHRFWDWNCKEFIFAKIPGDKETERDPMMFARRPGGMWYGVNWNYMLDVRGGVRKSSAYDWSKCAMEMGRRMVWNESADRYDYYDLKNGRRIEE